MLRLHNSLSRRTEDFEPADGRTVRLYTCGPTVYDYAHIGNFRSFVFYDLLCRWLRCKGWEVHQVMNITDVDDKTIRGAAHASESLEAFTRRYEALFLEDLARLQVDPPWKTPRATEHIEAMLELIAGLVAGGHAYVAEGSVYFALSSFPHYGRLSGVERGSEARDAAYGRLQGDEYERQQADDFALWKAAREGEPSWGSPWGPGRPGWHIECSAMARMYLGETLDIHCGGVDLLFPHHENEIAQSEALTGKPFSRFWLHAEHLLVDGQKMSKSLGNYYTLASLLEMGHSAVALRHTYLGAHYGKQLNFTLDGLQQSEHALAHLYAFLQRLPQLTLPEGSTPAATEMIDAARNGFATAMDADLNVPGAMGTVFEAIRETNSLLDEGGFAAGDREALLAFLSDADRVLGIMEEQLRAARADGNAGALDEEVACLVTERTEARKARDFARADAIRDDLLARGIALEDTPTGTIWRTV